MYNTLLGRLSIHTFGVVLSTLHQCMKFVTDQGEVGTILGKQAAIGQYYYQVVNLSKQESIVTKETEEIVEEVCDEKEAIGNTKTLEVGLGLFKIGTNMAREIEARLVKTIQQQQPLLVGRENRFTR